MKIGKPCKSLEWPYLYFILLSNTHGYIPLAKWYHPDINGEARPINHISISGILWLCKFILFSLLALHHLTLAENMLDFVCWLVPLENNLICASQMFPYIGLRRYRCLTLPISRRAEIFWTLFGCCFSAKFLVNISWNPTTNSWTWIYLS